MKCVAALCPRERRRIKNDRVEFLSAPRQPPQRRPHIVGDEFMTADWQRIEREISSAPLQRFLGKIDINRLRARRRCRHGERARVGEAIQQPLRRSLSDESAIFPLIHKQSDRIPCPKIDPEFEMMFGRDRLQIFAFIANDELWRLALLIFLRQKPAENPAGRKLNRFAPVVELVSETIACGCCYERNQNVVIEPLRPATVDRAKAMRIGPFSFKGIQQPAVDPVRFFHSNPLDSRAIHDF